MDHDFFNLGHSLIGPLKEFNSETLLILLPISIDNPVRELQRLFKRQRTIAAVGEKSNA
jgi:hypothetical protein